MKVLLTQSVLNLGQIGDVVEVKPGYARNYLLPQRLAVTPTEANLRAIEEEKRKHQEELARERRDKEQIASQIEGKEITISARANPEGHLYGSVGPAQIVAALSEEGIFIQPQNVMLGEPIDRLDRHEVRIRLANEVEAGIHVWVTPLHEAGETPESPQQSGPPEQIPVEAEPTGEAEPSGGEQTREE